MTTYTVNSKNEHKNGYSIHLSVNDAAGNATLEQVSITTKDKAVADSYAVGDTYTLVKSK